jgi:four helix bundle protein
VFDIQQSVIGNQKQIIHMKKLEDLRIYNKSIELIKQIYKLINNNKELSRDFSLCDQIKRASVSVSTNIAEGYYRSQRQTKNYLAIASGSANETVTLLVIINSVYSLNTEDLQNEYKVLGKQINAFSKTILY